MSMYSTPPADFDAVQYARDVEAEQDPTLGMPEPEPVQCPHEHTDIMVEVGGDFDGCRLLWCFDCDTVVTVTPQPDVRAA